MFGIQVWFVQTSYKVFILFKMKTRISLKQFLLYMSEGSLPFCGILLTATDGFLHVSGSHKSLILLDSSFFFDLCLSEKSKEGWGCIILVNIHFPRTIYQPYFPLCLFPDRKQKYTISVEWKKVVLFSWLFHLFWGHREDAGAYPSCIGVKAGYRYFLTLYSWLIPSETCSVIHCPMDPPCVLMTAPSLWPSEGCAEDKYTLSFYALPKQLTFSIITPWKQSLWGSSLQQPTKFNLGQWPPCKLLFNTFMNRQAC